MFMQRQVVAPLDMPEEGPSLDRNGVVKKLCFLIQWTLIITDPFITDFGYNGHDFVLFFTNFRDFVRYIRIFGKKSEKIEKIGHYLRFLGQNRAKITIFFITHNRQ